MRKLLTTSFPSIHAHSTECYMHSLDSAYIVHKMLRLPLLRIEMKSLIRRDRQVRPERGLNCAHDPYLPCSKGCTPRKFARGHQLYVVSVNN